MIGWLAFLIEIIDDIYVSLHKVPAPRRPVVYCIWPVSTWMALLDLYVADRWVVIAYEMKVKAVIVVGMFSVIPQLVTLMQGRRYISKVGDG